MPSPAARPGNGNHAATEKQVEQPALAGPQDAAPDEDAKDDVGSAEEEEEAEDDGAGDDPPSCAGDGRELEEKDADSRWLETLSEPELDLMISLKELADTQAGHPDLLSHRNRFHLRTLRALGIVLLEHFKDQQLLRGEFPSCRLDRLALLRDPPHSISSKSDDVDKKRKQQHQEEDVLGEESTSSSKKRRT